MQATYKFKSPIKNWYINIDMSDGWTNLGHFAFGVLNANCASIRREQKRALKGGHCLGGAANILVLYKGNGRPAFGVHSQSGEPGKAVQQQQWRLCKVSLAWLCTGVGGSRGNCTGSSGKYSTVINSKFCLQYHFSS